MTDKIFFAIFVATIILFNLLIGCRIHIERTTINNEPKKLVLEGHEYWVSNTNIAHSASCPCKIGVGEQCF